MIELPHIVLAFFVHLKLKVAAIMLSLVGEIWFIAISITVSIETVVAHHLQNFSGKSGWKVNGMEHDFLGHSSGKFLIKP